MTTRKRIAQFVNGSITVKVFRDSAYEEYVCRVYWMGALQPQCDYFTTDKDDALSTGERMSIDYRHFAEGE